MINSPFRRFSLHLVTLLIALCAHDLHAQSGRTIVVDAGHGGFDRGGVPYQRLGEKNLTPDVAHRPKRGLQGPGFRGIMTRDRDGFVPLGTRTSIANSYRGATFVSVHFNSSTRSGANGVETYY